MATGISINPLTFSQRKLFIDGSNQPNMREISKFLDDLGQWANQIQSILVNPSVLASVLNSNQALTRALSFVQVKSTPTTNQTVDTKQSSLVWIFYTWATAANFTATLNNVVDGAVVMFFFSNSSGAARTITLAANTPTPTVMLVSSAINTLSAGVSVNTGINVAFVGVASATNATILGTGQNW